MNLRLLVLILFVITGLNNKAQQFQFNSASLRLGSEFQFRKADLNTMASLFPEAEFVNTDFTNFKNDSTVLPTITPLQFEFYMSFGKKNVSESWKDHLELRLLIGTADWYVGYDNRVSEKFTPNSNSEIEGILHREQYEFSWQTISSYLGAELIHMGDIRGKRRLKNYYYGARFTSGAGFSKMFNYHLSGEYHAQIENFGSLDSYYKYYFPPVSYTEEYYSSALKTSFYSSYGLVGGSQYHYGKKDRLLIGWHGILGANLMVNGNGNVYHSFSGAFSLFFGLERLKPTIENQVHTE